MAPSDDQHDRDESTIARPALADDSVRAFGFDLPDEDWGARVHGALTPDDGSVTVTAAPFREHLSRGRAGTRVGRYRLNRIIASGGMGTVYEATQEQPRRTVAVKLMKAGFASRSARRRFEYESQILGRLRHPNIAQVFDAGTHRDGDTVVPYFAMEYIPDAQPITTYARKKKLGTRERLRLFRQVCDATHHGHQKGIIHRDLKPSNILVDSSGQVKVIDFGVARSTDSDVVVTTLQTGEGQLIGTLQYMSPEQCAAEPHEIDTRTDVYSLGVTLYEILCGQLPYELKRAAIHEATRVIREQEPTKLSSFNKTLRGDVETIAQKALEKDRNRRYQGASELSADIGRYLNNEPISARPPSLAYQLRVFARRNRGAVVAGATVMLVLVVATVVSTALYLRAQRAEIKALAAAEESKLEAKRAQHVQEFLSNMLSAVDPARAKGEDVSVLQVLDAAAARIGDELGDEPEVEMAVRWTIAETYLQLGRYADSIPHYEAVVELARRLDGLESEEALRAESRLTEGVYQFGNVGDALLRFRALAPRIERTFPHDSEQYIKFRNEFANTMRAAGLNEEAEPILERALRLSRRHLGVAHPETATCALNMGWIYMNLGKYAEAEPLFLEAISVREKQHGTESPWTIRAKREAAGFYLRMGRFEDAERWGWEAVDTARRVLPPGHIDLSLSYNVYLASLQRLGRSAEGEQEARELLSILQHLADSPDATADELNLYAWTMLTAEPSHLRDAGAALAYAKRADALSNHGNHMILDTLALGFFRTGHVDKAIETQQRAIEVLPRRHHATSDMIKRLVEFIREGGKVDSIEALMRPIYLKRAAEHGEADPPALYVLRTLGDELNRAGRHAQAESISREVLDVLKRNDSADQTEVASTLVHLGKSILLDDRAKEAEEPLRKAVKTITNVHGECTLLFGEARHWLGRCLLAQGRFDEGVTEFAAAYEEFLSLDTEEGGKSAREAARRQADLYDQWHAAAPGNGYNVKAAEWRKKLPREENGDPEEY